MTSVASSEGLQSARVLLVVMLGIFPFFYMDKLRNVLGDWGEVGEDQEGTVEEGVQALEE
jgi:hypothetical protein